MQNTSKDTENHGKAARRRGLGKNVRSVDGHKRSQAKSAAKRREAHKLKQVSASLIAKSDPKLSDRVAACGVRGHGQAGKCVTLERVTRGGVAKAYMTGLQTCQSPWACPVCSAARSAEAVESVNKAIAWARAQGAAVSMLTLTFSHKRRDRLSETLNAMKDAVRAFRQSKGWRALGVETIAATEITHGHNGWHPHQHIIVLGASQQQLEQMRCEWTRSLAKQGLTCNENGYQVQDASHAGAYVASWGAAEELTLNHEKKGQGESLTPFQILAQASEPSRIHARLWVEYVTATKGRSQLQWSRGLREKVERWAEEQGEGEGGEEPEPVPEVVHVFSHDEWRTARLRKMAILEAAETGGCIFAAARGETDRERWLRERRESRLIDYEEAETLAA